ncbi:hypothetical protein B0178_03520 [Streptococcus pseudopneumoniae]|nr:hypothetical protein B0177_02580 [Streptococcus pseudopneumoniae]OOR86214.1 hypothetical protein B0178_03520 [Streptococcus pseudopneumoniae]
MRRHGLISKSISKRYYQVAIPFTRLFCLVLVSIDYIYSEKRRKNLRTISGLVIKFFSQYRKVEKVVVFHEYVR